MPILALRDTGTELVLIYSNSDCFTGPTYYTHRRVQRTLHHVLEDQDDWVSGASPSCPYDAYIFPAAEYIIIKVEILAVLSKTPHRERSCCKSE